jgi:hypothetical protein
VRWCGSKLEWIGVDWAGQKPIPKLPNAVFRPAREFIHAWAGIRSSRGFDRFPRRSSCSQTRPKGLFGRAPAPPKTVPALAPLVEWLLWWS